MVGLINLCMRSGAHLNGLMLHVAPAGLGGCLDPAVLLCLPPYTSKGVLRHT